MSGFGGFSFGSSNPTTTAATGSTFGSTSTFGSSAIQNRTATTGALPSFGSLSTATPAATSQASTGFGSLANTSQQPLTGSLFNLSGTANAPATAATTQPAAGTGFSFNFSNQAKPATTATATPAFGSLFSTASTQPQTTANQTTTQASTGGFNLNLGGTSSLTASSTTPAFSLSTPQTAQQSSLLGNTTANQSLTAGNTTAPVGLNLTTSAAKPPASTGFGGLSFNSSSLATTAPLTSNLTTSTLATSLAQNVTTTNLTNTQQSTGLTGSLAAPTSTTQQQTSAVAAQPSQPAAPPQPTQMTFKQLEGYINVWLNELNQMEKDFQTQSQTINSWDSLLVNNGLKITSLNENLDLLKEEHKRIDQQLDFVISQQNELEQLLEPLEKVQVDLNINDTATTEREFTYSLVDTVSNDLQSIGTELHSFIKKLNETKANQDANDPLSSIGKILNSHLDALQYIEHQISVLKRNIET